MPTDVGLMVHDATHSCKAPFNGVHIITSHTKKQVFSWIMQGGLTDLRELILVFIGAMLPELFIYVPICLNSIRSQG